MNWLRSRVRRNSSDADTAPQQQQVGGSSGSTQPPTTTQNLPVDAASIIPPENDRHRSSSIVSASGVEVDCGVGETRIVYSSSTAPYYGVVEGAGAGSIVDWIRPATAVLTTTAPPGMIPLEQNQDGRIEVFAVECLISVQFYQSAVDSQTGTDDPYLDARLVQVVSFWRASNLVRELTQQTDFHVLMRIGSDTGFDLVLRYGNAETLQMFVDHSTFDGEYINNDGHGGLPLFDPVCDLSIGKLTVLEQVWMLIH